MKPTSSRHHCCHFSSSSLSLKWFEFHYNKHNLCSARAKLLIWQLYPIWLQIKYYAFQNRCALNIVRNTDSFVIHISDQPNKKHFGESARHRLNNEPSRKFMMKKRKQIDNLCNALKIRDQYTTLSFHLFVLLKIIFHQIQPIKS